MPEPEYLQMGGQAVIEGVMMRSPGHFAVAVRSPKGEIVVKSEPLESTWIGRQQWLKWPFFRGSLALLDTMALGARAMRYAAKVITEAEDEMKREAAGTNELPLVKPSQARMQDAAIGGALVIGLGMGLFLFNYLPNLIAQSLERFGASGTQINLVVEIIKVTFFLLYLWGIGQMPEIREVFRYHGAEHKAINSHENGNGLSLDAVRQQTRLHPRCGTSFAIVVLIISFVVFTFIPRYPFGQPKGWFIDATTRFGIELLLLPFISGLAYEGIRLAGKNKNSRWVQAAFWPGLMSQYLTTREPEDKHLEVAIASLEAVIIEEARASGKLRQTDPEWTEHEMPAASSD
jgi:uncharacterized protein YqhQ